MQPSFKEWNKAPLDAKEPVSGCKRLQVVQKIAIWKNADSNRVPSDFQVVQL
jgi:hypothetical protein